MKLRYGGDLQIGDFILVAGNGYTIPGWYIGEGQNTLQYYHFVIPGSMLQNFEEWQSGKLDSNHWRAPMYKKYGFSSKVLHKDYIYGSGIDDGASRVVKITNPESLFTDQEDLEAYRKSKEALIQLKFPLK